MLGLYHVDVTAAALQALGTVPRNVQLLAELSKSPDDIMIKPPVELFESPSLGMSAPDLQYRMPPALERSIIRAATTTKLQYRLDRIRQVMPLPQDPYILLRYALHDAQKCIGLCRTIMQRLATQQLGTIRTARLLGDFCHFALDAITPVHQYSFAQYLEQPGTMAGSLIGMVLEELATHGPYEKAMYDSKERFGDDVAYMGAQLAPLAEIQQVRALLATPIGPIAARVL